MKEDLPFLFWAYVIIWGLVSGYVGMLFARQSKLRRQIEDLSREIGGEETGES